MQDNLVKRELIKLIQPLTFSNDLPAAMKQEVHHHYLRFRQVVSKASFQLMWVWAGTMLLGMGIMYYKEINGEKVRCEDIKLGCS